MIINSNINEKVDIIVTEKFINKDGKEETTINFLDVTLSHDSAVALYKELSHSCSYDEESNPLLKQIIDDYYNHEEKKIDYINVKFDCYFIAKMNNELNTSKKETK